MVGSFGTTRASVLRIFFGALGALGAKEASVLGVLFGGRHAKTSWMW